MATALVPSNSPAPTYAVSLRGCAEVPASVCIAAEVRYAGTLERTLGSSQEVVRTLLAVKRLAVDDGGINQDLDVEDSHLVTRWLSAAEAARQDGFNGLEGATDAWFDAHLIHCG